MSMAFYHWGAWSSETACVRARASRLVGRTIGYWNEKQRPVLRLSYYASGAPPPDVAENNHTTSRRIYI